jgi:hypothetical protein
MDNDRKLRVRRDGPGYGVAEYREDYREWIFNQEPFPIKAEAVDFMEEKGVPERDWQADRRDWAQGCSNQVLAAFPLFYSRLASRLIICASRPSKPAAITAAVLLAADTTTTSGRRT